MEQLMAWTSNSRRSEVRSFRQTARRSRDEHAIEMPVGDALSEGWLTQYGTDYFREAPRFEIEFDVSTLVGRLSLQETVYAILGRPPNDQHTQRHFLVTRLVDAGYRCLRTSTRKNPRHASILAECADEDIEAHRAWWEDPGRTRLESLAESEV